MFTGSTVILRHIGNSAGCVQFAFCFYVLLKERAIIMGKHFGELAKVSGIVTFRLSPHEQKAFAGVISHGVPNMFRRFSENVFRVTPPFIISYFLYDWAKHEHEKQTRKNPKDFENDV